MSSRHKTPLFLKIILALLGLTIVIPAGLLAVFWLINVSNDVIISSGQKRRFLLYVPKSYDSSRPTPLVITIHGFAQWPAHQAEISRWNKLADEQGFIVVYPAGTQFPMRWNSYGRPGTPSSEQEVQFISNLIDHLQKKYNIDPHRVYANGLSNGAGMAVLLSCRLSDRIAAIGGVAGAYGMPWSACQTPRRVPMMIFHGTADPIVPFEGSYNHSVHFNLPSIRTWVEEAARIYGCSAPPEVLSPTGKVTGVRYSSCPQDTEIVFYTIEGGGHTWPGGGWIPYFIAGNINKDVDATHLMWEFFQKHPL
jgi:polyhydroxybutyrate depolymerase